MRFFAVSKSATLLSCLAAVVSVFFFTAQSALAQPTATPISVTNPIVTEGTTPSAAASASATVSADINTQELANAKIRIIQNLVTKVSNGFRSILNAVLSSMNTGAGAPGTDTSGTATPGTATPGSATTGTATPAPAGPGGSRITQ